MLFSKGMKEKNGQMALSVCALAGVGDQEEEGTEGEKTERETSFFH